MKPKAKRKAREWWIVVNRHDCIYHGYIGEVSAKTCVTNDYKPGSVKAIKVREVLPRRKAK